MLSPYARLGCPVSGATQYFPFGGGQGRAGEIAVPRWIAWRFRVVWQPVARLCSLSHNILIIRALYCANPCVFPVYLRKWAVYRIPLVSSVLCYYPQSLSDTVCRILRCSIVRVIQLYQTILLYMPPLYKAVYSWVCVGFVADAPEWEYSMFLYITFPFFGFHWRGFPCNLPLNFLE